MKFKVIIIILLVILVISSIAGCTRPKFEDTALDVPQITVSSDSIDETGKLLIDTVADKKPNNPLVATKAHILHGMP